MGELTFGINGQSHKQRQKKTGDFIDAICKEWEKKEEKNKN